MSLRLSGSVPQIGVALCAVLILLGMSVTLSVTSGDSEPVRVSVPQSLRVVKQGAFLAHPEDLAEQARHASARLPLLYPEKPVVIETDPFMQLKLVGLDGPGLKKFAQARRIDLGEVASLDISRIDLDDIDISDRRCMTQAIYYEARNQPIAGQMAVADVILNRVNSTRYPNSVCGVVYEGSERVTGCQFSFTCDGSLEKPIERDAMVRAQILATAVLGGFHVPLTLQATNYHADYMTPVWAQRLVETARIGNHIFYKRQPRGQKLAMVTPSLKDDLHPDVEVADGVGERP